MPSDDVTIKTLPAVRVAELIGTATSYVPSSIGPVIQPLYGELFRRLESERIVPAGPGLAYYEGTADGGVLVHAGVIVDAPIGTRGDLRIVDLPPVERAATILHRGSMDEVMPTVRALTRWIDEHGYGWSGFAREISLECPEDRSAWVTELQAPLTSS